MSEMLSDLLAIALTAAPLFLLGLARGRARGYADGLNAAAASARTSALWLRRTHPAEANELERFAESQEARAARYRGETHG